MGKTRTKRNGAINREFPPHSARFEDQFRGTKRCDGMSVPYLGWTLPCILLAFPKLSSCLATFVSQLCGIWGRGKAERWLFLLLLLLQEAPNLICTLLRLPRLNSLRYTRQYHSKNLWHLRFIFKIIISLDRHRIKKFCRRKLSEKIHCAYLNNFFPQLFELRNPKLK